MMAEKLRKTQEVLRQETGRLVSGTRCEEISRSY
jgi:hypothetical protein